MPYLRCYQHSLRYVDVYEAHLKDENDFDQPSPKTWVLTIQKDGSLDFPEELLQLLDWRAGDDLEWFETGDDEFLLVKIDKP